MAPHLGQLRPQLVVRLPELVASVAVRLELGHELVVVRDDGTVCVRAFLAGLILTLDVMPALMDAGDIPRANAGLMRMMQVYFSVARSETIDNESMKLKHLRSAVWTGTAFKDILVLSPEFTWGLFGEHGELITQAIETASQRAGSSTT